MHSIRTKISIATVGAILITMIIATVLGVVAIRSIGVSSAEDMLMILCEAGQKNLDDYLEDLEQDIAAISAYVENDLDGISVTRLQSHLDRVSEFFKKVMQKTDGVKTYYYRIDPSISETVKGFWYVDEDGTGFRKHKMTDLTEYDTSDTSQILWFTIPKYEGKTVWIPPYVTETINVRVISYNMPIYFKGQFIGVIGIELDYTAMAEQVDNITLYDSGYAFVTTEEGGIVYHPHMDSDSAEDLTGVLEEFSHPNTIIQYTYQGVRKKAVWRPLSNGDHLNVTVPVKEINASWKLWAFVLTITFSVLIIAFVLFILHFSAKITKPLRQLTEVAEQVDAGNYECALEYKGRDEIGTLTNTFKRVTEHLKSYITDLNDLAYADALTSLHNKGAFDICVKDIQAQIDESTDNVAFAVCIFDCNDLKKVNDRSGHDKGDIYLKETAQIICEVFEHSPVFRIGGDEFAAILTNQDYEARDELLQHFDERCRELRRENKDVWEQVNVARGMAVYDPAEDDTVSDVVRRADKIMYENKFFIKQQAEKGA